MLCDLFPPLVHLLNMSSPPRKKVSRRLFDDGPVGTPSTIGKPGTSSTPAGGAVGGAPATPGKGDESSIIDGFWSMEDDWRELTTAAKLSPGWGGHDSSKLNIGFVGGYDCWQIGNSHRDCEWYNTLSPELYDVAMCGAKVDVRIQHLPNLVEDLGISVKLLIIDLGQDDLKKKFKSPEEYANRLVASAKEQLDLFHIGHCIILECLPQRAMGFMARRAVSHNEKVKTFNTKLKALCHDEVHFTFWEHDFMHEGEPEKLISQTGWNLTFEGVTKYMASIVRAVLTIGVPKLTDREA